MQTTGLQSFADSPEAYPHCWHVSRINEPVVFSIIRLFPAQKHRAQVIELLRSVQDLARPYPGCVGCWLSEEDFLQNHIRYAEQWESEEALHDHIRSELYRRVLTAMELSRQQPEVKFYYCYEAKGLELIEAARREARLNEPASDVS